MAASADSLERALGALSAKDALHIVRVVQSIYIIP